MTKDVPPGPPSSLPPPLTKGDALAPLLTPEGKRPKDSGQKVTYGDLTLANIDEQDKEDLERQKNIERDSYKLGDDAGKMTVWEDPVAHTFGARSRTRRASEPFRLRRSSMIVPGPASEFARPLEDTRKIASNRETVAWR